MIYNSQLYQQSIWIIQTALGTALGYDWSLIIVHLLIEHLFTCHRPQSICLSTTGFSMALRPVLLQTDQVHIQSVWVAHNMSLFFQESHKFLFLSNSDTVKRLLNHICSTTSQTSQNAQPDQNRNQHHCSLFDQINQFFHHFDHTTYQTTKHLRSYLSGRSAKSCPEGREPGEAAEECSRLNVSDKQASFITVWLHNLQSD